MTSQPQRGTHEGRPTTQMSTSDAQVRSLGGPAHPTPSSPTPGVETAVGQAALISASSTSVSDGRSQPNTASVGSWYATDVEPTLSLRTPCGAMNERCAVRQVIVVSTSG